MVRLEQLMGPPVTTVTVFMMRSPPPPEVVIDTSATASPAEVVMRAQVAVPVASAALSWVMAEKVSTPEATEPQGSEQVSVPSRVCEVMAVSGPAGLVPVPAHRRPIAAETAGLDLEVQQ